MSRGIIIRDLRIKDLPYVKVKQYWGWFDKDRIVLKEPKRLPKNALGTPLPLEFYYGDHLKIEYA